MHPEAVEAVAVVERAEARLAVLVVPVCSTSIKKVSHKVQTGKGLMAGTLPTSPGKVIIEPHRHGGVFIAKGAKESLLVTKNLVPGESVYGEKRVSVEETDAATGDKTKTEYRVWNPFRSKLAAGILGGLDNIHIAPGKKVLYLGAASGTSVSHVADVVGPVSLQTSQLLRLGNTC